MSFLMESDDEEKKNKAQKDEELEFAFLSFLRNHTKPEHTDDDLLNSFKRVLAKRRSTQNFAQDSSPNTTETSENEKTEAGLRPLSPPTFQSTPFASTKSSPTGSLNTTPKKRRFNHPSPLLESGGSPTETSLFDGALDLFTTMDYAAETTPAKETFNTLSTLDLSALEVYSPQSDIPGRFQEILIRKSPEETIIVPSLGTPEDLPKGSRDQTLIASSSNSNHIRLSNDLPKVPSKDAIPKSLPEHLPQESCEGQRLPKDLPETAINQNDASTDEDIIPSFTKIINKFARATNTTMKIKEPILRKSTWLEAVLPIKIGDILQADHFSVDEHVYFKHNDKIFRTVKITGVVRSIDLREKKCHFLLYDDTGRIEVRYYFNPRLLEVKQEANEAFRKASTNLRETRQGKLVRKFEVPVSDEEEYRKYLTEETEQMAIFRLAKKTILLGRSGPMHTDIKFGMNLIVVGTVRQYINDGTDIVRVIYPWAVQENHEFG